MPSKDIARRRAASQKHYIANRQKMIQRAKEWTKKERAIITGIIRAAKAKPCADCDVQYPYYVMQFDHVRSVKLFDIGGFSSAGKGRSAVVAEIEKCDVVCANCHATRTHERRILAGEEDISGELAPNELTLFDNPLWPKGQGA